MACEANARQSGIHQGQSLSDARALNPGLEPVHYDPQAQARILHEIALWCERYTPLVALAGDDGLFLDISGCSHLFGGEAAMFDDMLARLAAQGLSCRASIADTPGAAWAMAWFGSSCIVPDGEQASAIAGFSVAALRISRKTTKALCGVGLKTIGCIENLPRAPLASRFGKDLLRRLDQALGLEDEVISPLRPVAELASEKRFVEPIVHEDDIRQAISILADNIMPLLEKRGLGARRCEIRLFRVDGAVSSLLVNAASPLRDPSRIAALFFERIAGLHDDLDAGFGFDLARLNILEADQFDEGQGDLIDPSGPGDGYAALIDRLGARLGTARVRRFVLADTHIPERSFGTIPVARSGSCHDIMRQCCAPRDCLTRPVMLLDHPEMVDVLAAVPDGPPVRFRWRKVPYEVVRSEGPERIACEWWRDGRGAFARDYFRVEEREGRRFWIFRYGLYVRETSRPTWYMHGLFA